MLQTYIVKAGDTLYGISNQYGVSVNDLISINNVNPSNLQIGQVLNIPSNSGTNPSNSFPYVVKKGDTLYSIAKKYDTTTSVLIDFNKLKSINLSIGQIIMIPETYISDEEITLPSFINYVVKKGDTLYSIAKNYNLSVDTIIKDNALSSNVIDIGQNLKIRVFDKGEIEECYGVDYTPPKTETYINYIVKKGDSLWKIANNYGITVSDITSLNNLKSTTLSIGQQLKIPTVSSEKEYIVKSGDNLYSIANKFNTTVDSIKKKNNLTSNLLTIGQKLII